MSEIDVASYKLLEVLNDYETVCSRGFSCGLLRMV